MKDSALQLSQSVALRFFIYICNIYSKNKIYIYKTKNMTPMPFAIFYKICTRRIIVIGRSY